jgi:hypothetical protein
VSILLPRLAVAALLRGLDHVHSTTSSWRRREEEGWVPTTEQTDAWAFALPPPADQKGAELRFATADRTEYLSIRAAALLTLLCSR